MVEQNFFEIASIQNDPNAVRNKTHEQVIGYTECSPHKLSDTFQDEIINISEGAARKVNNSGTRLREELSEHTSNKKNFNVTNYLGKKTKIDFKH